MNGEEEGEEAVKCCGNGGWRSLKLDRRVWVVRALERSLKIIHISAIAFPNQSYCNECIRGGKRYS